MLNIIIEKDENNNQCVDSKRLMFTKNRKFLCKKSIDDKFSIIIKRQIDNINDSIIENQYDKKIDKLTS